MIKSKKVSIGIGIGVLVGVAVIVFAFTNIDDLLSKDLTEYTSEVKLTNPIQTYKINTECDFVNFIFTVENHGKLLRIFDQKTDVIKQKWLEKGGGSLSYNESISTIREITVKMILNEFSINPKLTALVDGIPTGPITSHPLYQNILLNPNCEIYESTAKANKEFGSRGQTQSSSKIPEGVERRGALGSEHSHAAILVKVFGDTFDFSLPAYQIKTSWIHFEGEDGTTVHKHATGVTLGYLFDSLELKLDDKCFVFQDGRQFCTNDDYTLNFYINGEKVNDIRKYEPMDKDRILIVYGAETPEEIQDLLKQVDTQPIIEKIKETTEESKKSEEPKDTKKEIDVDEEITIPKAPVKLISIPKETATPGCEVQDLCYDPSSVTVSVGTIITWKNDDTAAHTVTSGRPQAPDGIFDSGLFMSGNMYSYTFESKGDFDYYCIVHPWMTGSVSVR